MAVEQLGNYRLIEELGSGGMGVVYLAVDPNNKPVAVKVLHPSIANDQTARMRLAREVRTLRRIQHPRIAAVLDAELETDTPYVVTEFVDGLTLSDDVRENGPFAEDELVHFGHALLDALTAVHNAGVVHRDLKPANVMIMDGEPMVIDFGIAQAADEVKVTVTGLVMGTPGYLSPEIVDGKQSNEKTDWWGWAATMAFAATGHNPYGSGGIEAVIARVASGRANLQGVPERFVPLLRACLDPKPERRPSGQMILEALVEIESGQVPSLGGAVPAPPPAPNLGDTMVGGPAIPAPPDANAGFAGQPAFDNGPALPNNDLGAHSQDRHSAMGLMGSPRPGGHPVQQHVPPANIQPPPQDFTQQPAYASAPVGTPHPQYSSQHHYEQPAVLGPPAWASKLSALTVLALVLLSIALTALAPMITLGVVIVWQVLARTVGTMVKSHRDRIMATGKASASGTVARTPVALLTAGLLTAVGLILPLIAACAVALMMWLDVAGIVPRGYAEETALIAAASAGAVVMWFGPTSSNLRRGSRQIAAVAVGKSAVGHWCAIGLASVLAILALLTVASGVGVTWWPVQDSPFELLPVNDA
ncbi:serine/threonine-protein kinase [uncultured Brevibacterium sp.]|uniref:serine/threonine-protein kinase n=1 Tax=uncultured Brevibacterium sp. TaxID=189678 RepID=UPI0025CD96E4|nr:serine/threonine-protein kinase [uncultured Brevibacterium sp.]